MSSTGTVSEIAKSQLRTSSSWSASTSFLSPLHPVRFHLSRKRPSVSDEPKGIVGHTGYNEPSSYYSGLEVGLHVLTHLSLQTAIIHWESRHLCESRRLMECWKRYEAVLVGSWRTRKRDVQKKHCFPGVLEYTSCCTLHLLDYRTQFRIMSW